MLPLETNSCKDLREWVATRAACLLNYYKSGHQLRSRDGIHEFFRTLNTFHHDPDVDVHVYELAEWILTAETYLELNYLMLSRSPSEVTSVSALHIWEATKDTRSLPSYEIYKRAIKAAEEQAQLFGICQNRLWNVVSGCERAEFDLPALLLAIETSKQSNKFRHEENLGRKVAIGNDHHGCTPDVCHFASLDSTRVSQLHKCRPQDCKLIHFSSSVFNSSYERFTWWWDDQLFFKGPKVTKEKDYIAISHVWSDGTGVGVRSDRAVNRCLFKYFCQIAKELECKAIWWDTISVPIEREMRAAALKKMHLNFHDAKYTVVHDNYTVDYPWKDDGSPCIALVFSPWFNRGWTALELVVSKNVKVIFRDPKNKDEYVLKDLEKEVLAQHPALSSRGHWIASKIIRDLRDTKVDSLSGLSRILKTRNTSWPRDRYVIAALLAGIVPDLTHTNMQTKITQDIIMSFSKIDASFLLHGQPTISELGPFSWCPSNVFSEGPHIDYRGGYFDVDQRTGTVKGWCSCQLIDTIMKPRLLPLSSHHSARWKIKAALTDSEHCLLLWPYSWSQKDRAILVRVDAFTDYGSFHKRHLDCHFIGTVYGAYYDSDDHKSQILVGAQISLGENAPFMYIGAAELLQQYSDEMVTVTP